MINSLLFTLLACGEKEVTETEENQSTEEVKEGCEDGVCILSGTITEDLKLTSDFKIFE